MSENPARNPSRLKRWLKRLAIALLIVCCLWVCADFGYSAYVQNKIDKWESTVTRNEDGVGQGCEAFSMGPSSETALLLVHGINDTPHVFQRTATYLSEKGVHCRSMRLKGFGQSVEDYREAKIEDWLACIDDEVQLLKRKHKRVVVVAHSLGGAISINYVADRPNQVDALILAAPAVDVSNQRSPVLSVRFWHSLLGATLIFSDTTYSPFGVDALDPQEKTNEYRTPFTPISTIDRVFELIDRNQNAAEKIQMPLMICLAEQDHVIDNLAAEKFFEASNSQCKKLVRLENSAHAIMVDYQWKEFSEAVFQFVQQLENADSSR